MRVNNLLFIITYAQTYPLTILLQLHSVDVISLYKVTRILRSSSVICYSTKKLHIFIVLRLHKVLGHVSPLGD